MPRLGLTYRQEAGREGYQCCLLRQDKPFHGHGGAVLLERWRDPIGLGLNDRCSLPHAHSEAGFSQHWNIVFVIADGQDPIGVDAEPFRQHQEPVAFVGRWGSSFHQVLV